MASQAQELGHQCDLKLLVWRSLWQRLATAAVRVLDNCVCGEGTHHAAVRLVEGKVDAALGKGQVLHVADVLQAAGRGWRGDRKHEGQE